MANENDKAGARPAAGPGYYLVGEFLSAFEGDAYEDSRGVTKIPLSVKVLVADEAVTVRYNDATKGRTVVDGAQRGQLVTLRVYPRLVKPKDNPAGAFLKLEGFVPRA